MDESVGNHTSSSSFAATMKLISRMIRGNCGRPPKSGVSSPMVMIVVIKIPCFRNQVAHH
jgi:hypothetical protein